MKNFLLLLMFCICAGSYLFATVRTVSNTPSTIAQFNNIQAAVDASSSGDTIYVHGSPNAYANFVINSKQLVLMGPGWAPDKNLPQIAILGQVEINGTGASGTELHGFVFGTAIYLQTTPIVQNVRFFRNYINSFIYLTGSGTYNGYLFEGNFFANAQVQATTGSTYQNFLFQNNIFYETGCCVDGNINGFHNSINVLFNHNLWYGPSSGSRQVAGNSNRFLSFTNNVFVRRNAASNISLSTFNNNVTYNAGTNAPWSFNSNVNSGGNIENQDPQMVDQAGVDAGTNNGLMNFTIAAGPANNAGSDGKDIGLLYDPVGSLNWANSRASRLPFIFSMNITNPTIAAGGTLTVNVEARKNN